MMKVGEIFFPDDQYFYQFKIDCTTDDAWALCYNKSGCRVATKANSLSPFNLLRVHL